MAAAGIDTGPVERNRGGRRCAVVRRPDRQSAGRVPCGYRTFSWHGLAASRVTADGHPLTRLGTSISATSTVGSSWTWPRPECGSMCDSRRRIWEECAQSGPDAAVMAGWYSPTTGDKFSWCAPIIRAGPLCGDVSVDQGSRDRGGPADRPVPRRHTERPWRALNRTPCRRARSWCAGRSTYRHGQRVSTAAGHSHLQVPASPRGSGGTGPRFGRADALHQPLGRVSTTGSSRTTQSGEGGAPRLERAGAPDRYPQRGKYPWNSPGEKQTGRRHCVAPDADSPSWGWGRTGLACRLRRPGCSTLGWGSHVKHHGERVTNAQSIG